MPFWKWCKTAGPYVVGGTKIALDILSKVASITHSPCLKPAIDLALQIITIVEEVKANRDDAKRLIERLASLLLVIANTCDGKNDDELPQDVRDGVARLTRELNDILVGVKHMQASTNPRKFGNLVKSGLLYVKNGQKIKNYIARTGWAMDVFRVEGRIQDALRLRDMQIDVKTIRGAVENMQTVRLNAEDSPLISSSVLPSQPPKLYGRDEEVNNIANRVTSTASPRLAILGPGGIGKTALLLAVREHSFVKEKFGESRLFVRCEQATSTALFVELIARSLHMENSSSDRMAEVMTRLRSTNDPILLLLDNFETPWDIPGEQTRVEEILCLLASLPHVAILITMRSNLPPSTDIPWSRPLLEPLPVLEKEAARDLYISIEPNAGGDDSLDALLGELSYMPLAIKLMASLGRTGGTPSGLLQTWRDKAVGMDLLDGTDKTKSVNISIRLSIENNLMRSVPEALALLSVLAMLPAGANTVLLPRIVPSIRNLILAQAALQGATLINFDSSSQTLQLLSPIRAYVLRHHSPSNDLKDALYDAYTRFVTEHSLDITEPGFSRDARALSVEETNLEAILPESIQSGSKASIDSAITFCRYQLYTRPRLEVIHNTVQACRKTRNLDSLARSTYILGRLLTKLCRYEEARTVYQESDGGFKELGDCLGANNCLRGLGDLHRIQGRYDDARAAFTEADRISKELGDKLGEAQSLRRLADVHRLQGRYNEAQVSYKEAGRVHKELGNRLGEAQCLKGLGHIHRMQGRYDEAQRTYKEADRLYVELGDRLSAAQCLRGLGDVHWSQDRYDQARTAYETAGRVCKELGDRLGAAQCLQGLGDVHRMQDRYDEAQTVIKEADRVYRELGDRVGVVQCLKGFGRIHYMQDRYDEAQAAFKEAEKLCKELGNRPGVAQCLQFLGDVHFVQGRYGEAWTAFKEGNRLYEESGSRLGATQCLHSLGDVYMMQDECDQAQAVFTEADRTYKKLGDRFGVAQCLQGLGGVHRIQGRYEEAQAAFRDADRVYEELGDRFGAAQCLQAFGGIHWIQGRYDEARAAFEDADRVYKELGDRLGVAQCLEGLGHVRRMRGQWGEARTIFSQAAVLFKELGQNVHADRCLNSLYAIT